MSGFVLRWFGRMRLASWTEMRVARTLPHLVDTLFLGSGLALAWRLTLLDTLPDWLLAKLIGLVIYIILGILAMRSAPRVPVSVCLFLGAVVCFGWIVSVAIFKTPLPLVQ